MFAIKRTARAATGVAAALMALALAFPAGVMADTELGDSGEIGPHSLRDSMNKPGVTCHYKTFGNNLLKSFIVRPPRLSSDDAFPADVGWRVRIQRKGPSSSTWNTIFNSSVQHGTASAGVYANFTKRTIAPTFPNDPNPFFTDYRVLILLYQFYGDGSVAGFSKHRVDWYRDDQLDATFGPGGACSRQTGVV